MGRQVFRPAYLLLVVVVTAFVVAVPAVVVWALRRNGLVTGFWPCLAVAVALAFLASVGGSALWRRHTLLRGVVFSDLLVWGWLRRVYTEWQIRRALRSLDRLGAPGENVETRTKVLTQLAQALDQRDPYLRGHSRRVARHATRTARRMGLHGQEVALIQTAALLHDIGKLHIPPDVVQKPGSLTEAERAVIRRHVEESAAMVEPLGDPRLTAIVLHHHERFDGGGYPSGLKQREIPLGSRVIAVADTFDAITSDRPYRAAAPDKRALDILRQEVDTQFDPDAAHALIAYYSDRDISVLSSLFGLLAEPLSGSAQGGLEGGAVGAVHSAIPAALPAALTAAVVASAVVVGTHARTHPQASASLAAHVGRTAGDQSSSSPFTRGGGLQPPARSVAHYPPRARTPSGVVAARNSSSSTASAAAVRSPSPSSASTRQHPSSSSAAPRPSSAPSTAPSTISSTSTASPASATSSSSRSTSSSSTQGRDRGRTASAQTADGRSRNRRRWRSGQRARRSQMVNPHHRAGSDCQWYAERGPHSKSQHAGGGERHAARTARRWYDGRYVGEASNGTWPVRLRCSGDSSSGRRATSGRRRGSGGRRIGVRPIRRPTTTTSTATASTTTSTATTTTATPRRGLLAIYPAGRRRQHNASLQAGSGSRMAASSQREGSKDART